MKEEPTSDELPDQDVRATRASANFQKILDQHGYSFQEAVSARAEELRRVKKSVWTLFGTELPVYCQNQTTHVDLVLRGQENPSRRGGYFLIGECKRVNPVKGHWCFAKSKYTWFGHRNSQAQFEQIRHFGPSQFGASTKSAHTDRGVYNLGLEVKTGDVGDPAGHKTGPAINEAVGQVLKSTSGFINYSALDTGVLELDTPVIFIPAIFTTARLFTTEAELGTASLDNGLLPPGAVQVKEEDWLFFNVNRSTDFRHDVPFDYRDSAEKHLSRQFREFTRTIVIVGPKGIDKFLSTDLSEWLW